MSSTRAFSGTAGCVGLALIVSAGPAAAGPSGPWMGAQIERALVREGWTPSQAPSASYEVGNVYSTSGTSAVSWAEDCFAELEVREVAYSGVEVTNAMKVSVDAELGSWNVGVGVRKKTSLRFASPRHQATSQLQMQQHMRCSAYLAGREDFESLYVVQEVLRATVEMKRESELDAAARIALLGGAAEASAATAMGRTSAEPIVVAYKARPVSHLLGDIASEARVNPAGVGTLRITTDPPGVRIVVDGIHTTAPTPKLPFKPGKYTISVDDVGFESVTRNVKIAPGEDIDLPLSPKMLTEVLTVDAVDLDDQPVRASVAINRKVLGTTPWTGKVRRGRHVVAVGSWVQQVDLLEKTRLRAVVELARSARGDDAEEAERIRAIQDLRERQDAASLIQLGHLHLDQGRKVFAEELAALDVRYAECMYDATCSLDGLDIDTEASNAWITQALASFQAALALEPDDAEAILGAATAQIALGHRSEALTLLVGLARRDDLDDPAAVVRLLSATVRSLDGDAESLRPALEALASGARAHGLIDEVRTSFSELGAEALLNEGP